MSEAKPELYSSEYATWFKDPLVVAAYPSRPPYSEATIQLLARLAVDAPRRVLDVGCGPGDLARRLAPLVEHVEPVRPEARLLVHEPPRVAREPGPLEVRQRSLAEPGRQ